jgi:hypothetical protein
VVYWGQKKGGEPLRETYSEEEATMQFVLHWWYDDEYSTFLTRCYRWSIYCEECAPEEIPKALEIQEEMTEIAMQILGERFEGQRRLADAVRALRKAFPQYKIKAQYGQ